MNDIDMLIEKLTMMRVDYDKLFIKGNKSASTRLRKGLQDIINDCKSLRNKALEQKKIS
jgi:hypothetical protein